MGKTIDRRRAPGEREQGKFISSPAEKRSQAPEIRENSGSGRFAELAARAVRAQFGQGSAEEIAREAAQLRAQEASPVTPGAEGEGARDVRNRHERRVGRRLQQDLRRGTTKGRRVRKPEAHRTKAAAEVLRREQKSAKAARQDAERARRQIEYVAANELEGKPLPFVPHDLWCMVRAICLDYSGATARHWLRMCPNKVLTAHVRRCALIPTEGGAPHYDWGHQRARDVVAVGALLFGMQRSVRMPQGWGQRRWSAVTSGLCRRMILTALSPNERHRKSERYLTGVYGWGGRWDSTPHARGTKPGPGCGIITALEQVGALYRSRWQGQGFATLSGFQPNEYWLTSAVAEYGYDDEETAHRAALVAEELALEVEEARAERPGPFDIYQRGGPEPPAQTQLG